MTLDEHIDHFTRRILQDALAEASATYWRKRAAAFEAARPNPADYPGQAWRDHHTARWRELTEIAQACRNRAAVALIPDIPELDAVAE